MNIYKKDGYNVSIVQTPTTSPPAPSASNHGRIAPDINELSLMRQRQRGCATEAAVHIGPSAIARVGEAPVTHNLR